MHFGNMHEMCAKKMGGGPMIVVSTAAFHARGRGSFPGLGGVKETKMFLPHSLVTSVLWGASILGSSLQGLNFISYLEGCVISLISLSSGCSPGPI